MKKLTANFYPLKEAIACSNGATLLGHSQVTIAGAFNLNGISVFRDAGGEIDIAFPKFGTGERSHVVPHSKEAYAAIRDVIAMAVNDQEHHFGHNNGTYGFGEKHKDLVLAGDLVSEPYADGRFSLSIADLVTCYNITTAMREGTKGEFVAVDMPTISSYTKEDGTTRYQAAFEGVTSKWTDKEGKEQSNDYSVTLRRMVRNYRGQKIHEREQAQGKDDKKPSLNDQMKGAEARKGGKKEPDAPGKENER